jgi:NADH dehydrogenase
VVGGGFGGLRLVRELRRDPVDILLVDRRNFHLFQPLLYQVATGGLVAGEIATPLRKVLRRQKNVIVLMAEVDGFDLAAREVLVTRTAAGERMAVPYDSLVVAAGARHAYFGHPEWEGDAPGLKSVEDALELRRRILTAFEAAEAEEDPARETAWLTFCVVGAGPTGVEMAGQIAEIARDTVRHDFRRFDPRRARILLLEAADRVLTGFRPSLSERAARSLADLGVTVRTGVTVTDVCADRVVVRTSGATDETIPCRTVVWAAGVAASPLARALADAAGDGAETDGAGRLVVGPDLTVPGHPEVLALGDMVSVRDPERDRPLPGVAPVAMQQGRFAAAVVRARVRGEDPPARFTYRDKGNLATIGRYRAVAEIGRVGLSGVVAWLLWLAVHITYLIGFQNRLLVLLRWSGSFVSHGRGSRLITGEGAGTRPPEP